MYPAFGGLNPGHNKYPRVCPYKLLRSFETCFLIRFETLRFDSSFIVPLLRRSGRIRNVKVLQPLDDEQLDTVLRWLAQPKQRGLTCWPTPR
jgi:hypothetical protein